jgi:Kef-type K+ transport system membrane component KefB
VFCRALHLVLRRIKQPRVIAEVIAGIILGPSVFGHIPNFNNVIFPASSIPLLTLVSNLGLVFFLFLVGMEVDLKVMRQNARVALAVSVLGMVLPFGMGVAVAVGLWNNFETQENFSFGLYALFIGVAMAITAFPVLARILTELKLLGTNVGTIVLSAGVVSKNCILCSVLMPNRETTLLVGFFLLSLLLW